MWVMWVMWVISTEQETYVERLDEIRRKLRNGEYGVDDDIDTDSLKDDLEEVTFA